jgi:hypothetical protein
VGVVFHLQASATRDEAGESAARYDDVIDDFRRQRAIAIGGYIAAAALAGTGAWLLLGDDGATVQVSWTY